MPAIAPIEDLRNAQEELLSQSLVFTTDALPACSKPWRRQVPHDLRLRMTLSSMFTRSEPLDLRSLGVGGWRRWACPLGALA